MLLINELSANERRNLYTDEMFLYDIKDHEFFEDKHTAPIFEAAVKAAACKHYMDTVSMGKFPWFSESLENQIKEAHHMLHEYLNMLCKTNPEYATVIEHIADNRVKYDK